MKENNRKPYIQRDEFIQFLASCTPEDINNLIAEKGKPPKLIEPIIFFKDKEDSSKDKTKV